MEIIITMSNPDTPSAALVLNGLVPSHPEADDNLVPDLLPLLQRHLSSMRFSRQGYYEVIVREGDGFQGVSALMNMAREVEEALRRLIPPQLNPYFHQTLRLVIPAQVGSPPIRGRAGNRS